MALSSSQKRAEFPPRAVKTPNKIQVTVTCVSNPYNAIIIVSLLSMAFHAETFGRFRFSDSLVLYN